MDLRKPKIADEFGIEGNYGLVNYLIGQADIDEIIYKSEIENYDVIPSGPVPPNPSELIIGTQTRDLFEALKQRYDYIIIDSPPLGLVADSMGRPNSAMP